MGSEHKSNAKKRTASRQMDSDRIVYLASLIDNISDALISTDMEFKVLEWNAAAERMYGWTAAEIAGHPLPEFIQYEFPQASQADIIKLVREQGAWKGELIHNRRDGTRFPAMISVSLARNQVGDPIGFVAIHRDMTEQVRAEKQILQMKRLYATLSQVNQTIVRVKDREDLYRSLCEIAVQFGEFSVAWIGLLDDASGNILPAAATPLDVDRWPLPIANIHTGPLSNGLVARAVREAQVVTSDDVQTEIQISFLREQFETYGFHASAVVPFHLRGKVIGALILVSPETGLFQDAGEVKLLEEMGLDISFALDKMQTELERKSAEERFSKAFRSSPVAIILSRVKDGTFIDVNYAACQIYGYPREELIGHTSLELGIIDTQERSKLINALQSQGLLREVEVRIHSRDKGVRLVLYSMELLDVDGVQCLLTAMIDISERKQAEEALRESEERFSTAFFISPVAQSIIAQGTNEIMAINDACCDLFGYLREELIGASTAKLNLWENPADRLAAVEELQNTGRLRAREATIRMKSGETRTLIVAITPILWKGIPSLISSMLDITDRKEAEAALQLENGRFQRFVESNIVGIVIADVSGRIITANDYYLKLLGLTRQDFLDGNVDWRKFTPAEWLPADEKAIQELREHGVCEPYEKEYERADGTRVPVFLADAMLPGPEEQIAAFVLDITERKQAEQQIQRQLRYLQALRTIDTAISSSFDLKVMLDVVLEQVHSQLEADASAVLLVNHELQTIEYATSRGFHSDVLDHTRLNLGEGYAGRAVAERQIVHISKFMESGGTLAHTLQLESESFMDYYGVPLIVKGEVKGVLEIYQRSRLEADSEWMDFLEALAGQAAIAIDNAQLFENLQRSNANLERRVTARTLELHQANMELEHANRAKDEFLATMSHELRTPLNSVLGLSESLLEQKRGPLNENQQSSLQIIASSGQHLLELINDILDLSKIEAGKFDYYPQAIAVEEVCKSSLTFVKEQAARKSITLTYSNEASVSRIFADPRRLKQILVNLLNNAVKFTPEKGMVTLEVTCSLSEELIHFSVIDNGIGIAAEDLPKLFQPFVQVDSQLNRQYEGTGLGLALVRKLTDIQGGSIEVQSELGKGSRFTVHLACRQDEIAALESSSPASPIPQKDQTTNDIKAARREEQQGLILLAEDHPANVLTVSEYLEGYGYQMIVASDGLQALDQAAATQPDLILMDIQMPVMDGLEATRRLRANPQFAHTPIIALTALAMPGDRERCLEAGANEYMSKPVSLKALRAKIADLLKG